MSLKRFLLVLADTILQNPLRYFAAGHNGPYRDLDTPLRNSGHWLIFFSKCYLWSGEERFLGRVKLLAEYLHSLDARPYGYSFHHRQSKWRDNCNGLIGQAWTFEALAQASDVLKDPKYKQLASEVFFQHYYDEDYGLWNRLEIDGRYLPLDLTFNHQLWFAACASLIKTDRKEQTEERVRRFIDCIKDNLILLPNGLIYHPIERKHIDKYPMRLTFKAKLKQKIKNLLHSEGQQYKCQNGGRKNKLIHKSIGYHSFNMYAFAMLKQSIPDHLFWNSFQFQKMVSYMNTKEYIKNLDNNRYGYSYNPPGFEVPFSLTSINDDLDDKMLGLCEKWVNEQFARCYNSVTKMMECNTEDVLTHTARIYEITRLPEIYLEKIKLNNKFL